VRVKPLPRPLMGVVPIGCMSSHEHGDESMTRARALRWHRCAMLDARCLLTTIAGPISGADPMGPSLGPDSRLGRASSREISTLRGKSTEGHNRRASFYLQEMVWRAKDFQITHMQCD
jgi:hypothetical protein